MSYPLPDDPPPCPESRRIALAMLAVIPPGLPLPELGYDPDGETWMDWDRPGNNTVSVSVSAKGRLAVAWMSDEYGHSHGSCVMVFSGAWPADLVDIIRLIFPSYTVKP